MGTAISIASHCHKGSPRNSWLTRRMREMSLHLMHRSLVIELGKPSQRIGRDEPDASAPGIGNADQNEIGLNVSGGQGADSLLVQRHAFLRRPVGLIADSPASRR